MMKPFYLYLRPFDIDGHILVPNPERGNFWRNLMPTSYNGTEAYVNIEELILQAVGEHMPLIGIGKKTNVIGAGKVIARDDDWRRNFEALALEARCIFSIPSLHPSTLWELEWLAEHGLCARVMMILTSAHFNGPDKRFLLPDLVPHLNQIGWHLPDELTNSSLLTFDEHGSGIRHYPNSGHKLRHLLSCLKELTNVP